MSGKMWTPLCCYCDIAILDQGKIKGLDCMEGHKTFCEKYKGDCEACEKDRNKKCIDWINP